MAKFSDLRTTTGNVLGAVSSAAETVGNTCEAVNKLSTAANNYADVAVMHSAMQRDAFAATSELSKELAEDKLESKRLWLKQRKLDRDRKAQEMSK